jgi:hypothetical protein
MSAPRKPFDLQWRGSEKDPHYKGERKVSPRILSRRLIGAAILLLVLLLTYARHYYNSQLTVLNEELQTLKANEKDINRFAIITFETRDMTFWRESLGNKFDYARRHGYS